ncbi:stage II sporulation protein M [Peribacillus deserti]|uniref:Stage II sporulation protein M n=1 Tax=Peribacillus deserti TaxID=673318 RepID=A0ABS2QL53_9BACI|nr:stage II sporulation protein M [Peribacillus deserti]MBM7693188.1 stage II sporulation protein M [Peribacillus deserti]
MKKKSAVTFAAINHIKEHSSLYLFITILFLMGVIFGAIVVNSLSFSQKEDLFYYLSQFFGQVKQGRVDTIDGIFWQTVNHNVKYVGLIWILGISIIGLPIILILLFLKGMVVGFTVGFLVNQMGFNGFLLAFVSIFPQNIIIVPVFILITTLALSLSIKIIRRLFMKQLRDPLKPVIVKYFLSFACAVAVLLAAGAVETYLSPQLMKHVVSLVGSE